MRHAAGLKSCSTPTPSFIRADSELLEDDREGTPSPPIAIVQAGADVALSGDHEHGLDALGLSEVLRHIGYVAASVALARLDNLQPIESAVDPCAVCPKGLRLPHPLVVESLVVGSKHEHDRLV